MFVRTGMFPPLVSLAMVAAGHVTHVPHSACLCCGPLAFVQSHVTFR